jgi:hypothetical protein
MYLLHLLSFNPVTTYHLTIGHISAVTLFLYAVVTPQYFPVGFNNMQIFSSVSCTVTQYPQVLHEYGISTSTIPVLIF